MQSALKFRDKTTPWKQSLIRSLRGSGKGQLGAKGNRRLSWVKNAAHSLDRAIRWSRDLGVAIRWEAMRPRGARPKAETPNHGTNCDMNHRLELCVSYREGLSPQSHLSQVWQQRAGEPQPKLPSLCANSQPLIHVKSNLILLYLDCLSFLWVINNPGFSLLREVLDSRILLFLTGSIYKGKYQLILEVDLW